ncbi:MAG: ATP synthase F1 subunit delta [Candidatus Brocadiia bacterium]
MINANIAKRYASALIRIAQNKNIVGKTGEELLLALKVYLTSSLPRIILNPLISEQEKKSLLERMFTDKLSPNTMEFLKTLIIKKRFDLLPDITEIYGLLSDEAQNIIRVKVTSAFPLSASEENTLLAKLNIITRKKIVLKSELNKSLLGGMLIQLGDTVLDGSVKGRLRYMKEHMFN